MLLEAIDSVLAQSHREFEVIVVDDGSTDGTEGLVESLYGPDPRVRYLLRANQGVSSARNAGLDHSTGDYIAFLDSDDAWRPWHLSLMLRCLDSVPEAGLIWTDIEAVDADGNSISTFYLKELLTAYQYFSREDLFSTSIPLAGLGVDLPSGSLGRMLYAGDVFSQMVMGNLILTSSVVIRRERLDGVGRFDEGLISGEDYEFFLRATRAGPVAFADISDIRYRIGTSDRLSRPAMGPAMALAYLQVLDATLARDAERITLSPTMIAEARLNAHRWIGGAQLLAGSSRSARAHLRFVLRVRPFQPWVVLELALTYVPRTVFLC